VRDHWINQAKFIQENRTVGPTDGMRFEVADLYDLPKLGLEPFDFTLFKGIFYHLPDPITGLKAAADLTKEILVLDTPSGSTCRTGCSPSLRRARTS
jgi:tRNA (mo5U34)-methyltransferase